MALKSVYLPDPAVDNDVIEIAGEEHHHLVVTRAAPGEKVEVFDGRGKVWACAVMAVGKRATSLKVEGSSTIPQPSIELILGQALIRPAAFESALEKAVEVGVTRIIPFVASRSNVKLSRSDRWQRVIVEAAKQSKHFYLPVVNEPVPFQTILGVSAASRILFAEQGGRRPLKSCLQGSPVLYLIGPEGGWTDDELESANRAGFRAVSLRSGILRSETAALVGAALIRHELGDL
jgi:16S rRNA (uracil1498-N3)-methyltransferase